LEKLGLVMVILTMVVAGGVLYFVSQNPFNPSQQATTVTGVTCTSYSDTFTVIASQSGYNNSIGNGAPSKYWPVMCTHAGEEVTIKVVNVDSVEPHGFAVSGYLDAGVTVLPGRTDTITFYASAPGEFRVYCNVICAVHIFMQSGLLVVAK
jgi:nitrous oxide reductase